MGILTTDFDAGAENVTTIRASYKKPEPCGVRLTGTSLWNKRISKIVD